MLTGTRALRASTTEDCELPKAAIFDLDGTLLDSVGLHAIEKHMGDVAWPQRAESSNRRIVIAATYWGGHSRQVSPIESSASATATVAASDVTPGGKS
jgi:phosphoglycolate phosphatase-like HAD superfamily hydrolase